MDSNKLDYIGPPPPPEQADLFPEDAARAEQTLSLTLEEQADLSSLMYMAKQIIDRHEMGIPLRPFLTNVLLVLRGAR